MENCHCFISWTWWKEAGNLNLLITQVTGGKWATYYTHTHTLTVFTDH